MCTVIPRWWQLSTSSTARSSGEVGVGDDHILNALGGDDLRQLVELAE